MNDQNQRRMAAEMRRAKEAKEQAEKDAKAAILREQRAKLAPDPQNDPAKVLSLPYDQKLFRMAEHAVTRT